MHFEAKANVSAAGEAHLNNLLANPRARATVSRILNQEAVKMKVIAEEIAERELHRRPEDRRRWDGPEYHDSFSVKRAQGVGINRLLVPWGNSHPAAHIIERGSKDHPITTQRGPGASLKFPWDGTPSGVRSGRNQLGVFAITDADAPFVYPKAVKHPGTKGHHILERAVDLYRQRHGNVLNR